MLSGRAALPPTPEMWRQIDAFHEQQALVGVEKQYTHRQLGPVQWAYNQWIVDQLGPDVPAWPAWRGMLYTATGASRVANFDTYRDVPLPEVQPEAAAAEAAFRDEAAAVRAAERLPEEQQHEGGEGEDAVVGASAAAEST